MISFVLEVPLKRVEVPMLKVGLGSVELTLKQPTGEAACTAGSKGIHAVAIGSKGSLSRLIPYFRLPRPQRSFWCSRSLRMGDTEKCSK